MLDRWRGEADIVRQLNQVSFLRCADPLRQVAKEHPGVNIGSYPNVAQCTDAQSFRVRLQLESRDRQALDAAAAAVTAAIECTADPAN